MKIAHLIMAYKNPAQLGRLLDALAHPDADCYIHLDKKIDFAPFAFLQSRPNVYFTPTRLTISWGGYSLPKAVLECSRAILRHPAAYDFINVMSGQDYPLRPAAHIHQFLAGNLGRSFIECQAMGSGWWQANISRLSRYHLTDFSFRGRYAVQKVLNTLLPTRKFPLPYTLYGGPTASWFTLSRAGAAYTVGFLDAQPRLRRFAALTWAADEYLIPTILFNSPLKATISNDNLRYIDWSEGGAHPKGLTSADFPALQASPKLWARKFDTTLDATILDMLDAARQQPTPH